MEGRPASSPFLSQAAARPTAPVGEFVVLDGEDYYRIASFHRLPPFLMSLASDTDLWMFIASGGGLTAGRVDADGSLFPYQTVDQLHDAHHHTGPFTLIRIDGDVFEPKNAARMFFSREGNKAAVVRDDLAPAMDDSDLSIAAA